METRLVLVVVVVVIVVVLVVVNTVGGRGERVSIREQSELRFFCSRTRISKSEQLFSTARKLISREGDFLSIDNRVASVKIVRIVIILRYIHCRQTYSSFNSRKVVIGGLYLFCSRTFRAFNLLNWIRNSLEGERIRLDVSCRVQAYNVIFFSSNAFFSTFETFRKKSARTYTYVFSSLDFNSFRESRIWKTDSGQHGSSQMSLNYNHRGRSVSVGMRFQR